MFSYYGSKSKIIKSYPEPKYNIIIEPFCGSARYALRYYDRAIILNDLDTLIYNVWIYLIAVDSDEIANLPEMQKGQNVDSFNLTKIQKELMSFMLGYGTNGKRKTYTGRAARDNEIRRCKNRILNQLENIRHFQIFNLDLPDVEATWFIDPPYQNGGKYYRHHKINYAELAEWCKSRKGQVIVCENRSANWLPFKPLVEMQGGLRKTLEVIWTNN